MSSAGVIGVNPTLVSKSLRVAQDTQWCPENVRVWEDTGLSLTPFSTL